MISGVVVKEVLYDGRATWTTIFYLFFWNRFHVRLVDNNYIGESHCGEVVVVLGQHTGETVGTCTRDLKSLRVVCAHSPFSPQFICSTVTER